MPLLAMIASLAVVVPDVVVSPAGSFSAGPVRVQHSNVNDWAQWNYSGYERKGGWNELQNGIVATLDRIDRRYGCGRAMWEYNSDLNRFGTPESLMNLPLWTGGCIDSMEGLLFESSTSTPYHFLDQSELSAGPSDAMVGLPYGPVDVPLGVKHLQLLGVKYFFASSPSVQAQANADPSLSLVATSGPWRSPYQGQTVVTTWDFYVVHDSPLVRALTRTPEVLEGVGASQGSWLPLAVKWYMSPGLWGTELVSDGPASWVRTRDVPRLDSATSGGAAGSAVAADATAAATAAAASTSAELPPVSISRVQMTDDEVSFHVDRTGVPVLVSVSYFPAWHATGALGPYRAEPNLMLVVPTSHDVTLRYGSTGAGTLGKVLFLLGLVAVVVMLRRYRSLVAPSLR